MMSGLQARRARSPGPGARSLKPGALIFGAVIASLLVSATARAACMGRPTDPSGYEGYAYGDAEVKSHATQRVRVHWAASGGHAPSLKSTRQDGVPDTVAYAADTAETALAKYAEMGYRAVPSDAACSSNGGDGKLDVYLVRFRGADGACIAECVGNACSSFALVDSTFSGRAYADAQEGFRTVVTHELFHAIQNVYKTGDDPFWAEGTAQWAMKTVHPELQDFERNLPKFFAEPTRPLDAPPTGPVAGYLYGSAVWPLFLSLVHGPDVIREIFEAETDGSRPLEATDAVLRKRGSSLAEAYPLFGAWNAATAALAGTGGYPNAATYPGIATEELTDGVTNVTAGFSYFAYRGTLDGPQTIALETDETRNGAVLVPLEGGKARLDRAQRLPVDAEGEVLVVVAGITTKKTDAKFTIRVRAPEVAVTPPPSGGGDDGCHAAPGAPRGGDKATTKKTNLLPLVGVLLFALRLRRRR